MYLGVITNKLAPSVVPFFPKACRENGCPNLITSDLGFESAVVLHINHHAMLKWERDTGMVSERPAFHFCKSVNNQTVEQFWIETNVRIRTPTLVRKFRCVLNFN